MAALAPPSALADTLAMESARCAWCGERLRSESVSDHGVTYHAGCFAMRRAALGPELERLERDESSS